MEKLFLGIAREKITPAVGCQLYGYTPDTFSESLNDDLTATAFYFRQGNTQVLMVSLTVCLIQTALDADIRKMLEEKLGIPAGRCMLCATHTHSGPNTAGTTGWGEIDREYCDTIFIPQILSAAEKAVAVAQPVKMGTARADSLVGINRRELDIKNRIVLGQNPWGAFNPQMTVISFVSEAGEPVANMVHYGAHGTAAGRNHEISRDWSGLMIDALELQSGAVTAFFNGPEGDVGPRISNGLTVGDISYVRELGSVAAQDAVNIYRKIFSYSDAKLAVSEKELQIPLKKRMPLAEAKEMLKKYEGQTVNREGMICAHLEDVIRSYEEGTEDEESTGMPQTVIALGDVVFASFPYELFSEVGMRIDGAFKTKSVLSLSNTNGSEGYFITPDAICRGGYEVDMFLYGHRQQFVDNADFQLMKETVNHIQTMINESED